MPAYAIVGGQWGDEGKGKIVDYLTQDAHIVARYGGGSNAGHTVINNLGQFKLHLVPSGIFHKGKICIIGNGMVVNPRVLLREMGELEERNVDVSGLVISDRAHIILPFHTLIDGLEEEAKGGQAIGTTRQGIGPAYMDKAARLGLRAADLLDEKELLERLRQILEHENRLLQGIYHAQPLSLEPLYEECLGYKRKLSPFIRDIHEIVKQSLAKGENILLEGAQGTMLDVDHGTYPFVTSSHPSVGGACTGLGLSPRYIKGIAGVFKAYTTRVGGGPMPTELQDEVGERIRRIAWEYGTTTGRPRRCGWFDGVAASYSSQVNGLTGGVLTRLDVLDGMSPVKVCVAYRLDGKTIDYFPSRASDLARCQPVYREFKGWDKPTAGLQNLRDLSENAREYVKCIEDLLGCPLDFISTGPRREETIPIQPIFGE